MLKSKFTKTVVALISGGMFGSGMIISEMVNPNKVIAFLDISGNWDPSLAFVMIGAIATFAPFYHFIIKKRKQALNGETFSWAKNKKIDPTLISGAIIFGIGWGLVGLCPGPAVTNIASGGPVIALFIFSMLIGMGLAKWYVRNSTTHKK